MSSYGNKRDFKKIDLYVKHAEHLPFAYFGSTNWSRTCREAKAKLIEKYGFPEKDVRAWFSTDSKRPKGLKQVQL